MVCWACIPALTFRLDDLLARTRDVRVSRVPAFRACQRKCTELVTAERRRLRFDEYVPKIMSAFVRNRLLDEVYLPLIGDNLAKQLGTAGSPNAPTRWAFREDLFALSFVKNALTSNPILAPLSTRDGSPTCSNWPSCGGTLTTAQGARWAEVKSAHVRERALGGGEDDPVSRAVGAVGLLAGRVNSVASAIREAGVS
jgi:hypothetical protein